MVVGKVGIVMVPIKMELSLRFMAAKPVEVEPNHFSVVLDDGASEKACSRRVVHLDL